MNSQEKSLIRKMRLDGESYSRVAEIIKVSSNTIKSFCRRNNLQNIQSEVVTNDGICKNCKVKLENAKKNKKFRSKNAEWSGGKIIRKS